MKLSRVPGSSSDGRLTPEKGRRGGSRSAEGSRIVGGLVYDLLEKFHIGRLYGRILCNEGMKLLKAVNHCRGDRRAYDHRKVGLKVAFVVDLHPAPTVFDKVYDELAERVFEQVRPIFGFAEAGTAASGQ